MKEHSSQKRAKILTVLFVVMLLLPAPLWLLLAPHLDTTNYENRTLAAFPRIPASRNGPVPLRTGSTTTRLSAISSCP